MIDLYYWPTPNGKKVTILLEECGLALQHHPARYRAWRPVQATSSSSSIPTTACRRSSISEPKGGGAPIGVFESGAIMMYLAEKAGRFWPQDLRGKYEVTQWVMWQMANQGPKLGECGHFRRLGDTRGRPVLRGAPLHRRGQPPLRRAQQSPRTTGAISPATNTPSPT